MPAIALPRTGPAPAPRGRIGTGFSPVPHRYHLYLSAGCPRSLRVTIALALLGLEDSVTTTVLGADAASGRAGAAALRRAYEATGHHYDGRLTVPALCDTWSGRVVSNHTPDILDDLAVRLAGRPELRPPAPGAHTEAVRLLADGAAEPAGRQAALDELERRLTTHPYALGDRLTTADADLWVALTGAAARLPQGPRVRAYVRGLCGHPAFRAAERDPALCAGWKR
ncbi:glutathione S-transferase C-terminal domain-containing protein [Streptomyces sp. NPDC051567]|uniref:glutathione S-transferase C-terminal domain-containing protein n=1 Tax=Streptomyces sp. NPDC051567 TaxID=3365660 RepID=UPI0037BC7E65